MKTPFLSAVALLILFTACEQNDLINTPAKPSAEASPSAVITKQLQSISITPVKLILIPAETQKFTATATYDDSSSEDISTSAIWSVTGTIAGSASIDTNGLLTASAADTATVNAALSGLSATVTIEISPDYFVSAANGNDANIGSAKKPFATIDKAVAMSTAGVAKNIRIAAGNYTTTGITLKEKVNLLGGFNDTGWGRDVAANISTLTDIESTSGSSMPKGTVIADAAISNATLIDALTINGSSTGRSFTAAVRLNGGSPSVRRSLINGGTATSNSYGIYGDNAYASGPMVIDCKIDGGNGAMYTYGIYAYLSSTNNLRVERSTVKCATGSSTYSTAIYFGGSATYYPTIVSSLIVSSSGTTFCNGIDNQTSYGTMRTYNNIIIAGHTGASNATSIGIAYGQTPFIANNTIIAAASATGTAKIINLTYSAAGSYYNNIFYTPSGLARYGLYEQYSGSDPAVFKNNIFCENTVLYYDNDTSSNWILSTLNSNVSAPDGSGNLSIGPVSNLYFKNLAGNDLHLDASSPAASSGLNGTDLALPGFPVEIASGRGFDFDYVLRPVSGSPWSIGAYQYVP